jgi:hypothetical protein
MNWLKQILISQALKFGAKPIGKYFTEILKEKVSKTPTKLDDYGVQVLEKVINTDDYTIDNILLSAVTELNSISKETSNKYDDFATAFLLDIVENKAYNQKELIEKLFIHLELYVKSTPTLIDDGIVESLKIIIKEILNGRNTKNTNSIID